jgi:uncharacterized RDD family membrane protein YckC
VSPLERPEAPGGYGAGPVPPGAFAARDPDLPPPGPHELAEYSARAGAAVIDFLVKAVVAVAILIAAGAAFGIGFFAGDYKGGIIASLVAFILAMLAFAVASLLYEPVYMARTNGQTLGKQLTHCRVVRTSGEPMDFAWAMLREVVIKWLAIGVVGNGITAGFPVATLLDNLWPLWDAERRALHDFAASTRVVKA